MEILKLRYACPAKITVDSEIITKTSVERTITLRYDENEWHLCTENQHTKIKIKPLSASIHKELKINIDVPNNLYFIINNIKIQGYLNIENIKNIRQNRKWDRMENNALWNNNEEWSENIFNLQQLFGYEEYEEEEENWI